LTQQQTGRPNMSPNSLFMFICLSSFFTTRCKGFTTCCNSKLLMWNRVQSSCVPQDTTFARFIWGAGLLKQRGSPPAAEMRCASAWHAWNERLPEKYAISCSGAACLCTLQNASRCMQYDLNNFKISRHNPSEVSWCHESMKASCTTTWSPFFSTFFYFSNLSNCNLFELHVHVPSARNRRQDWGGLARGDGSSCHISQCSDFAFLWGSAKVNVWTSIDFHSGNQVTRNVILGELVQVSILQGFSRELQRLERFARAACAKDRRYQEVWSARGLATWKGTRFLDGTLLDFTHRNSKIARLQLHW